MSFPRTALPFVMVLLLALLVVACGGGDSSKDAGASDDTKSTSTTDSAAADEADAQESAEDRMSGGGAFAITPELASCMEAAGFTQDAPPTGGLAAWRHGAGGRAVVASSEDVTGGIADEIGTEFLAEVSGRVVLAAPAEHATAADDCLRRFAS